MADTHGCVHLKTEFQERKKIMFDFKCEAAHNESSPLDLHCLPTSRLNSEGKTFFLNFVNLIFFNSFFCCFKA